MVMMLVGVYDDMLNVVWGGVGGEYGMDLLLMMCVGDYDDDCNFVWGGVGGDLW